MTNEALALQLKTLPNSPGVYQYFDKDEVIFLFAPIERSTFKYYSTVFQCLVVFWVSNNSFYKYLEHFGV